MQQTTLFPNLPEQFNTSTATADLPLFQLAEVKARAAAKVVAPVVEQKAVELSTRAKQALELMKDGAYWRKQLETQFRGGEKFKTRLYKNGHALRGFGFQTHAEMESAGLLQWRETPRSSVWPTEWTLRAAQ